MKTNYLLLLLSFFLFGLCCAQSETLKFAYIYDGPIGDAGWTFSHDLARLELERRNENLRTFPYESIGYGQEAIDLIDDLASKNFSIIAFSSNGFVDSIQVAAKKHGSIFFIICDDIYPHPEPNVGSITYEKNGGEYLGGIIAGIRTVTNKIGFVTCCAESWIYSGVNAFALGARTVNPQAEVIVTYIEGWHNETLEYKAAENLILAHNADVITQHTDTFAPMLAASSQNKWGVGWGIDMTPLVGPSVLTSIVLDWYIGLQYEVDLYFAGNSNNTNMTRINWGVNHDLIHLTNLSSQFNKSEPRYQIFLDESQRLKSGNTSFFCGDYVKELDTNVTDCLTDDQIVNMSKLFSFVSVAPLPEEVATDITDDEDKPSSPSAILFPGHFAVVLLCIWCGLRM